MCRRVAALGFILGAFCVVGRGGKSLAMHGRLAKKYISRVQGTENGEWRGEKESNFFHCRDRRHRRSFSLSLFIIRVFSDAALRTNQRRKSGTKFIRRHCRAKEGEEGEGRALSLNFGSQGVAQRGVAGVTRRQNQSSRENGNYAKIGGTHANAKSPCVPGFICLN